MSTETGRYYEFGDFRLDLAAKTLLCGKETVPLTPKVFDTLQLLVEHAGRLLEKDELMQKIWQDRFVEESNLTFNIKMLRRALNDDAHQPRFIETVPRRGYRFIAEVRKGSPALVEPTVEPSPAPPVSARKRLYWTIPVVVVVLLGAVTFGVWLLTGRRAASAPPAAILTSPFKSEKLSSSGNVHALITPDGKYVAYTNETGGKQSIWLRQLETSENIQIVPPSDGVYLGLAISHDGNSLFFARRDRADEAQAAVYRVMTFGGIPAKVAERSEGWISVSPDDKQAAFVRCAYQQNDYCGLFVISTDGTNERRVLTLAKPNRISGNQFSHDGKSLIFAAGQSLTGGRDFRLQRVDLGSGAVSDVSATRFFTISRLESMPNEGFLFSARETLDGKLRVWEVLANGQTRALTNDTSNYNDLSVSRAGDKLVATHISNSFRLHLASVDDFNNQKVLIAARGVTFAPDGRLVYASDEGDLWSIDRDGSNQRQLTSNSFNDFSPCVSPDGRYVFFASNRTGSNQVWRMNADGSDQVQITRGEGGYPRLVTPDGKYVYFHSGLNRTLWQVSVNGGDEKQLSDKGGYSPTFSPDGKLAAFFIKEDSGRFSIAVMSVETRRILQTFATRAEDPDQMKIVWASDARGFNYFAGTGSQTTFWQQSLEGGKPRLLADLGGDDIGDIVLSPDGRTFALIRGKWIHDAVLIEGLK